MALFEYDPWLLEFIEVGQFGFQWDRGNRTKNLIRHGVKTDECEDVFLGGGALPIGMEVSPPVNESRYAVVGETTAGKPLFIVFTLRSGRVRVISARRVTKQEREDYDRLR
jgi:uncharacterized DUF497 family protein